MKFIGIDIGKNNFVAAFPSPAGYQPKTYPNSVAGIRKFISSLSPTENHCVMEATGNYGYLLLYLLYQTRIAVSLVNPKQIRHFTRMMMAVTKTDSKDACIIAMYGEKMNPPLYKMPPNAIILIKQQKTVIRQLKKQLIATKNLYGSLDVLPVKDHNCIQTLNKTIAFLTHQIESLEAELVCIANTEFEKQVKTLTSVKGIGITLATALIVTTGGFTYFDNAKQLSRFIGICPTYQQSGTSVNIRGGINKNGDTNLRSLLYVASWSAIQHNAACREYYKRLKEKGKPSKVALIAVANKLVRQAFAVASQNSTYVDGFCSSLKK